jgi:hypothetical protein
MNHVKYIVYTAYRTMPSYYFLFYFEIVHEAHREENKAIKITR